MLVVSSLPCKISCQTFATCRDGCFTLELHSAPHCVFEFPCVPLGRCYKLPFLSIALSVHLCVDMQVVCDGPRPQRHRAAHRPAGYQCLERAAGWPQTLGTVPTRHSKRGEALPASAAVL
jgi:hypothetical protein